MEFSVKNAKPLAVLIMIFLAQNTSHSDSYQENLHLE